MTYKTKRKHEMMLENKITIILGYRLSSTSSYYYFFPVYLRFNAVYKNCKLLFLKQNLLLGCFVFLLFKRMTTIEAMQTMTTARAIPTKMPVPAASSE